MPTKNRLRTTLGLLGVLMAFVCCQEPEGRSDDFDTLRGTLDEFRGISAASNGSERENSRFLFIETERGRTVLDDPEGLIDLRKSPLYREYIVFGHFDSDRLETFLSEKAERLPHELPVLLSDLMVVSGIHPVQPR